VPSSVTEADPAPVVVPFDVYREAIQPLPVIGRDLRLDPPSTQGVSTEWFTLSAFRDGHRALAGTYVDHERAEFAIALGMMTRWLDDLLAHVTETWAADPPIPGDLILGTPGRLQWPEVDRMASLASTQLHDAIEGGDERAFHAAQTAVRTAHVVINDLLVRWIHDLLTAIAEREGEDAVEEVMEVSYRKIWKDRYRSWFDLTGHQRLALSAEGMRSHYPGPGRRGDFGVEETNDTYVMVFDPCGTGGVLRRGDATTGRPAAVGLEGRGTTRRPHAWSFGLTGVPWYCTHCPMLLEYFPIRDFGRPIRPVLFDPDPGKPTRWIVPKETQPTDAAGPSLEGG
jgi:hypothetical protein